MRSYENSGYNPYNDNQRSETRSAGRNYYSNDFELGNGNHSNSFVSNRRDGMGSGRDTFANSGYASSSYNNNLGYGSGATYGSSGSGSRYGSGSNDYSSNYGSSGANYGSGNSDYYGSSNYGNYGNSDRYGSSGYYGSSSNRYNDYDSDNNGRSSWDRAGNKIENAWDRTKDRVSNAWDRVTNDNDNDSYRNSSYNRSNNYNSYGSGYGTNYGSSDYNDYDRGRYSSSNRYSSYDNDRNSDHDRGFLDKAGDEIKSWFGDDDAERRRRMDDARDYDSDNRYGSSRNNYTGPPYSYGSSSRRDYEW
ncbi:SWFGD domain-containing protein [Pontibacter sp. 172403-2]|uniref:SWFGD domain-containing protein n=1 Tax=Pontibacter rufus TaxID=2791028 RepID=UPI0018AF601B|nr:SWFGD domain-containing protein [Pontibacter sp. 172403-2]MBF9254201.1 SWFGD domain-containing protein [Pontibacter sp. 172403-2]